MSKTLLLACLLVLLIPGAARRLEAKGSSGGWMPITQEEKTIKDCPDNPGCAAMILYRSEDDNDPQTFMQKYFRIKIFTNQGRKYADVEVPYAKDDQRVSDIAARTIEPDGRVLDFDGKVYNKTLAKGKGVKVYEKAFTLPEVGPGSIIEYRYTVHWGSGRSLSDISPWLFSALVDLGAFSADQWQVQQDLFTLRAHFHFLPLKGGQVMWTWFGLASGVEPVKKGREVEMDVANIPALEKEEFMPPRATLQSRVDFFYVFKRYAHEDVHSTGWYWTAEGKDVAEAVEKFIGHHKSVEKEAEGLFSVSDPPEAKLRKLYARAQQVRNLSSERAKTEKESQRENLKENHNVEDVLKRGYGYGEEINELFIALARAAGFKAYLMEIAPRSRRPFVPGLLSWSQMRANVVEVQAGSHKYYLDPATPFCPFGLLPWEETASKGMRLEDDHAEFASTPAPMDDNSMIVRKAALALDAQGNLQGRLEVDFRGQEALDLRQDNRDEDAPGRKKALEDTVKGWLPSGAGVELKGAPDWKSSAMDLHAVFDLKVSGYATPAGHLLLLNPAVFQAKMKYPFQSSKRKYPVFFHSPFTHQDDVTITLPSGYGLQSLPAAATKATEYAFYEVEYKQETGAVHLELKLEMARYELPLASYTGLREFYQKARAGDAQQVVLRAAAPAQ